jgi:hypothetical protein
MRYLHTPASRVVSSCPVSSPIFRAGEDRRPASAQVRLGVLAQLVGYDGEPAGVAHRFDLPGHPTGAPRRRRLRPTPPGRVLRPFCSLSAAAQDISATNLHFRLPLDGPDDELKELGTS